MKTAWAMLGLLVLFLIPQAQAISYSQWNLAELQKNYRRGAADPAPWAGYWWPYNENGIANAQYDPNGLGPAAKLDRAFGYGNWVNAWEYAVHGFGVSAADWWGHCNGWATAAIMEKEPRESVTANGVKFDVRDRKAILSEYWLESGSDFVGTRVWSAYDFSSYAFWDVVPAEFHLIMANIVGRQKRALIIDRYTGYEVWNQPLVAYEFAPIKPEDYLGPDPRYSNVYRVNVTATIWWAEDDVKPDDVTPPFDWKETDYVTPRKLRYELWVDAPLEFDAKGNLVKSGDIILTNQGIGGQWKNGTSWEVLVESHPDFIWIPLSYAASSGYKNPRINDGWVNQNISAGQPLH